MSEEVDEGQEIAWWLKWLTRGVGAVGGITAGIGGILGIGCMQNNEVSVTCRLQALRMGNKLLLTTL